MKQSNQYSCQIIRETEGYHKKQLIIEFRKNKIWKLPSSVAGPTPCIPKNDRLKNV